MPFQFKFELNWVYGEHKGKDVLANFVISRFDKAIGNWAPAFRFIADDILESIVERQFESEGGAGGTKWQELAPSTLASRSGHGITRTSENTFILHHSGQLERSFRKGETDHREDISAKKLVWGSDVPYALFHQTGTGKGFNQARVATGPGTGRGMAMRKILDITPEAHADIERTLLGRGAQIARMAGFSVTGRGATPLEARQIGEAMLGNT